jgi:hypothetical protein
VHPGHSQSADDVVILLPAAAAVVDHGL